MTWLPEKRSSVASDNGHQDIQNEYLLSPMPVPSGGPARVEGSVPASAGGSVPIPVNPFQKYDFREKQLDFSASGLLLLRASRQLNSQLRFQRFDIVFPYHRFT